jgi:hypothetical protein
MVGGEWYDSLDLKAMVVTQGVRVSSRVYRHFRGRARLHLSPLTCNTMVLPDGSIVQLTDLAFHLAYLRSVFSLDSLKQIGSLRDLVTPFTLDLVAGAATLCHGGSPVTEVSFPPVTAFYEQRTSAGLPYLGNAVLQGTEWLSFQCLWPCDYARSGHSCQFCYSGGVFQSLAERGRPMPRTPSPQDAAEMAEFAITHEGAATGIQVTGGSTFDTQSECATIRDYLGAILDRVPRTTIPGEVLVYMTPPGDLEDADRLFDAGADRIACSLEVWDEAIAREVTPGKIRFAGRERQLAALRHIAAKHGPNRACSSFIVGVEPAESFLEGARHLAQLGIVPIASLWIPFGRPVRGERRAPGVEYYQTVKEGLARIYTDYGIHPPGGRGLNVCMCRDAWKWRESILADLGRRLGQEAQPGDV